jgi:UPF0755 protein
LRETRYFVIEPGKGVNQIASALADEGIIADAFIFRAAARITEAHRSLKAGEYEFPAGISMQGVLEKLEKGDVFLRKFTIPEGLTSWQIVQIINSEGNLAGETVPVPPEGSLMPETYHDVLGETKADKIAEMTKAMSQSVDILWKTRTPGLPFATKEEAVTLASIVEKETALPGERGKIAGVFINRLKKGMKLQTDPTVIYGITGGKIEDNGMGPLGRRLLRKDLEFDSPYNTYLYPGLPPGPIANPGRDSLDAAMHPEEHNFLYFVADGTGGHIFSTSLEEHNKNVAKWRVIRKQKKTSE